MYVMSQDAIYKTAAQYSDDDYGVVVAGILAQNADIGIEEAYKKITFISRDVIGRSLPEGEGGCVDLSEFMFVPDQIAYLQKKFHFANAESAKAFARVVEATVHNAFRDVAKAQLEMGITTDALLEEDEMLMHVAESMTTSIIIDAQDRLEGEERGR